MERTLVHRTTLLEAGCANGIQPFRPLRSNPGKIPAEVSLWADGKLVEAGILSLAGKECSVRYGGKTAKFKTQPGHIYTLNGDLKLK